MLLDATLFDAIMETESGVSAEDVGFGICECEILSSHMRFRPAERQFAFNNRTNTTWMVMIQMARGSAAIHCDESKVQTALERWAVLNQG